VIPWLVEARFPLGALEDEAGFRLARREFDGAIEQRLVADDATRLEPAGGGEDRLGMGIIDAGGELFCGKASKDDGMDGADTRAGQHRHHGLGNHRHVDDHPVALADTEILQNGGQRGHLVAQFAVADGALGTGHRAVIDQSRLVAAHCDMAIDGVVAGIAGRALEPAAIGAGLCIEDMVRRLVPVDRLCGPGPEGLRILLPAFVELRIGALRDSGHRFHPFGLDAIADTRLIFSMVTRTGGADKPAKSLKRALPRQGGAATIHHKRP